MLRKAQTSVCEEEDGRRGSLVSRLRVQFEGHIGQLWTACACGDEPEISEVYVAIWNAMLPEGSARVTGRSCEAAVAAAVEVSEELGCVPGVEYAAECDRLLYYGIRNLLPVHPEKQDFDADRSVATFLRRQLARWYFRPYRTALDGLDLIRGVLFTGRPLYYERILAHGISQFRVAQDHLTPAAPGYLESLSLLARQCGVLYDGYLLAAECRPGLKQPEGWTDYLRRLVALHGDGASPSTAYVAALVASAPKM